jgi:FkbM family methyltransferase
VHSGALKVMQLSDWRGVACVGERCLSASDISSAGLDWRGLLAAHATTTAPARCCTAPAGPPGLAHCTNRSSRRTYLSPCYLPEGLPRLGCTMSQGEEQFAYYAFFGGGTEAPVRGGTFLELGANNGIHATNTRALERCLGWRGVLAEGHPALFAQLRKNRPHSLSLGMAVCPTHTTANFTRRASVTSGILSQIDAHHLRRFRIPSSGPNATIPVPCAPLGDWLGLLRVGHVDLFSLDVEGAELLVLETLDWSRFSVGLMIVECAGSGSHGCLDRKDRAVTALLAARGLTPLGAYRARHDIWDLVFANRTALPQARWDWLSASSLVPTA